MLGILKLQELTMLFSQLGLSRYHAYQVQVFMDCGLVKISLHVREGLEKRKFLVLDREFPFFCASQSKSATKVSVIHKKIIQHCYQNALDFPPPWAICARIPWHRVATTTAAMEELLGNH